MTTLTNLQIAASYGDLLTTTNSGNGLSTTLQSLQDGLGNDSTVEIATNAINFSRSNGNQFQLDGIALTASATSINNICGEEAVFSGGFSLTFREVQGDANVLLTDVIVNVQNITGNPVTITLPDVADTNPGQMFWIKDALGNANADNITIDTDGGTIDGQPTFVLSENWQEAIIYSNGLTEYFLMSPV